MLFSKKNIFYALLSLIFLPLFSFGLSLQTTLSDKKVEEITLTQSIKLIETNTSYQMDQYSYGLRKKKVYGLVTVKVYLAELFVKNAKSLTADESTFLSQLEASGPIQLRLTMVRDLKGSDIYNAFVDSLEANGIEIKNANNELQTVLEEVKNYEKFKNKEVFSLTISWDGAGKATLHIQKPDGTIKSITGDKIFAQQLLSIWFGKASDPKLEDLKKELIKPTTK